MAYEKRGLRPFDTLDETQKLLNHLLKVQSPPIPDGYLPPLGNQGLDPLGVDARSGAIGGANGTLSLTPEQFTTNAYGLYFGVNEDDWRDLLNTLDRELREIYGTRARLPAAILVTATNTRLRQVVELLNEDYTTFSQSDSPRRIIVAAGDSAARHRPFRMPQDGCTITIQVILPDDLPPSERAPGRPWRKGSWLARVTVKVRASQGSGLAPRYLTPKIRERHEIGDLCSSFVDLRVDPSGISMVTDLSDVLSVYIDEEALKKATELKGNNEFATPAGEAMLLRWVMDTYRALVLAFRMDDRLDEFDPDSDDCRHTYLYSLLQQVADSSGISIDEALNVLTAQPHRFVALIENSLELLSTDNRLLQLRK